MSCSLTDPAIHVIQANAAGAHLSDLPTTVPVMTTTIAMVTVDAADALFLSDWWATQLDGTIVAENDGWFVIVALPSGQRLGFQKVDDPTPGKNRIHLDLTTDGDLDERVQALMDAGARNLGRREVPGFGWVTLADPDGNEFCVSAGQH